jgi:hypothetical protein
MQQWHKKMKRAVMSSKHEDIERDLQMDPRAGTCKAGSWVFHQTMESE